MITKYVIAVLAGLMIAFPGLVCAQPADGAHPTDTTRLPERMTTHQVVGLAEGALRFNATTRGIRLCDDTNAALTGVAFIAHQTEDAEVGRKRL